MVIEKYLSSMSENIIIYGAGYCGLMFSDLLIANGIRPFCFFDKNEKKTGMSFNGISVLPPSFISAHQDDLIIVCILNITIFDSIKEFLLSIGYKHIINIFDLRDDAILFKDQPLIFYMPTRWKDINAENISTVRGMLCDELSRKTYDAVVDFACGNNNADIPAFSMKDQYFAYDVYSKVDNEVFLDCGAFKGDILQYFFENNDDFKHYFAIEPDPENYKRIELLPQAANPRITVIKCAVSDKNETLKIRNFLNDNSVISNHGTDVQAFTLDDICKKYSIVPSFIKIDVEGYEHKLLSGSTNALSQNVTVAIAVYHKPDDLWELPVMISKRLPDHKLYLRSYLNVSETILYAVPPERCKK